MYSFNDVIGNTTMINIRNIYEKICKGSKSTLVDFANHSAVISLLNTTRCNEYLDDTEMIERWSCNTKVNCRNVPPFIVNLVKSRG